MAPEDDRVRLSLSGVTPDYRKNKHDDNQIDVMTRYYKYGGKYYNTASIIKYSITCQFGSYIHYIYIYIY